MGHAAVDGGIEVPITTLQRLEAPDVTAQLRKGASSICLVTIDGENDLALALVGSPLTERPWIVTAALDDAAPGLWRKVLAHLPHVAKLEQTTGPVAIDKAARPVVAQMAGASFHPANGDSPAVVALCVNASNLWPLEVGCVAFVRLSPALCSSFADGFGALEAPSSPDPLFFRWSLLK